MRNHTDRRTSNTGGQVITLNKTVLLEEIIDWKEYVEYVNKKAIERAKCQNWNYTKNKVGEGYQSEDEVTFFMGASAIFFFLKSQDKLPSSWALCPMTNQSIIPLETLRENGLIE